jgi:hypothetical protein
MACGGAEAQCGCDADSRPAPEDGRRDADRTRQAGRLSHWRFYELVDQLSCRTDCGRGLLRW